MGEAEHEVRAGLAKTRPGGADGGESKCVEMVLVVAAKEQEGGSKVSPKRLAQASRPPTLLLTPSD